MSDILIRERTVGDVTILDCDGKLDIDEGSLRLRKVIRNLADKGHKSIILNFSGITYIDASGIGELVSGFTYVTKLGGTLRLLNLTRKVQDLLAVTKLLNVFDVYDREDDAISSYSKTV